jgi:hypothetical protein
MFGVTETVEASGPNLGAQLALTTGYSPFGPFCLSLSSTLFLAAIPAEQLKAYRRNLNEFSPGAEETNLATAVGTPSHVPLSVWGEPLILGITSLRDVYQGRVLARSIGKIESAVAPLGFWRVFKFAIWAPHACILSCVF